jgi:hypothetical protein
LLGYLVVLLEITVDETGGLLLLEWALFAIALLLE